MWAVYFWTIARPWTLTKTLENTIDSFQRRLLRIAVLNVRWPNIATNDTVYAVTRQIPWSQVITRRELSWLGHLFRLSETPQLRLHSNYTDLHDENETLRHGIRMGSSWRQIGVERFHRAGVPNGIFTCQLSTHDRLT